MNPRARAFLFCSFFFVYARGSRPRSEKMWFFFFFMWGRKQAFFLFTCGERNKKRKERKGEKLFKNSSNTQNKKSARIYITRNDKHPHNPRARNKRRKNAPDRGQTRGRFTVVQRRARSVRGDDDFYQRRDDDDDDDKEQETVWRFTLPRGKREGDGVHAKLSE